MHCAHQKAIIDPRQPTRIVPTLLALNFRQNPVVAQNMPELQCCGIMSVSQGHVRSLAIAFTIQNNNTFKQDENIMPRQNLNIFS